MQANQKGGIARQQIRAAIGIEVKIVFLRFDLHLNGCPVAADRRHEVELHAPGDDAAAGAGRGINRANWFELGRRADQLIAVALRHGAGEFQKIIFPAFRGEGQPFDELLRNVRRDFCDFHFDEDLICADIEREQRV